jgi:Fe-Mn family superoxide dismutase
MMRAGARRRKSLPGGARRHAMCSRSSMTVRFDPYPVREFDLSGLAGISDKTLEMHFKLYAGYVKETNRLDELIAGFLRDGRIDPEEQPAYSELSRRRGFESNGMVLHEFYFSNLKKGGSDDPPANSAFARAAAESFGSFATWKADFTGIGKMRGVGWALCSQDPATGALRNHWITLHEIGNVAGSVPLLVMDVWEHAFLLDYAPADRPKYIEAFFRNVDWGVVASRLVRETAPRTGAKPAARAH